MPKFQWKWEKDDQRPIVSAQRKRKLALKRAKKQKAIAKSLFPESKSKQRPPFLREYSKLDCDVLSVKDCWLVPLDVGWIVHQWADEAATSVDNQLAPVTLKHPVDESTITFSCSRPRTWPTRPGNCWQLLAIVRGSRWFHAVTLTINVPDNGKGFNSVKRSITAALGNLAASAVHIVDRVIMAEMLDAMSGGIRRAYAGTSDLDKFDEKVEPLVHGPAKFHDFIHQINGYVDLVEGRYVGAIEKPVMTKRVLDRRRPGKETSKWVKVATRPSEKS